MKNILIAEDEEGVRRHLGVLLEKNGYSVKTVPNGREALDAVVASVKGGKPGFDLLITDVDMPLMGGFELLDELEKNGLSIPPVVITGSEDRKTVLEALRRGCHEFIDKPLIVNDVIRKVNSTFIKLGKKGGRDSDEDLCEETQILKRKEKKLQTKRLISERSIGSYKLLKVIGEGAVGTVFLCEHIVNHQRYAMKIVRMNIAANEREESVVGRFINESNAISQLNHPNIVNFIEFGYSGTMPTRIPYIVMEYFEGKSLKYFLRDPHKLKLEHKLYIIVQIAQALSAVHRKNILHRDIKPDNILVDKSLNVKITDFGICHLPTSDLTRTSDLMGSPGYMAPEYLKYGTADKTIDIYALGVVSYELLLGVRPFEGDCLVDLVRKITEEHPKEPKKLIPDFPEGLQEILAKMLRKNPRKRYQDASEIIEDLKKVSSSEKHSGFFEKIKNAVIPQKDWN